MKYSLELEGYSSAWVSSCPSGHNPTRIDKNGNYFGENIYFSWTSWIPEIHQIGSDSVNAWYNEVLLFPNSSIKPFQYTEATGHYSQVAWADSDEVGCGIVTCLDSSQVA